MSNQYDSLIQQAAQQAGVDPYALKGLLMSESSLNPGAISRDKNGNPIAYGIAQFTPATAKSMGVRDPMDPRQAITGAAQLLRQNLDQNNGDLAQAIATYKAGSDRSGWGPITTSGTMKALRYADQFRSQSLQANDPLLQDLRKGAASASAVKGNPQPAAGQNDPLLHDLLAGSQQKNTAPASPPSAPSGGDKPGVVMSTLMGAAHGFGSAVLSGQELVGKGVSQMGENLGVDELKQAGNWLTNDAQQGQQRINAELQPNQQAHPIATGLGQAAGSVAAMEATGASGLLGKSAAAQGAMYGLAQGASDPNGGSFIQQKAEQAAGGALLGGIGAKIADKVAPALSKGWNYARSKLGMLSSGNATEAAQGIINDVLQQAGVDPSKVAPGAMEQPVNQVAQALRTGAKPVPGAADTIARIGEAASLPVPVELSAGQAARDPMQYALERNWRGVRGVGEPIQAMEARQNAALAENLDALGAGSAPSRIDVSRNLMKAANEFDDKWQGTISKVYDAVKGTNGLPAAVDATAAMGDVGKKLSESFIAPESLPGDVQRIYRGMQDGTLPLTVNDMLSVDKMLSRAQGSATDGNVRYAIGQIRQGLANAEVSGADGDAAIAMYNKAKAMAKQRFDFIDANPWYKDALSGAEPDKYFQKHVLNGNAAPLNTMMNGLRQYNPQLAQQVQGAVADFLKSKAAPRASGEEVPAFNHATFSKLVTDPNNVERLRAVFSPQDFDTLQSINNVARNIKTPPPGANVNYSGTAGAYLDATMNGAKGLATQGIMHVLPQPLSTLASLGHAAYQGAKNIAGRQKMAQSIFNPVMATPGTTRSAQTLRPVFESFGSRLSSLASRHSAKQEGGGE
jgi:hypothetical protein